MKLLLENLWMFWGEILFWSLLGAMSLAELCGHSGSVMGEGYSQDIVVLTIFVFKSCFV